MARLVTPRIAGKSAGLTWARLVVMAAGVAFAVLLWAGRVPVLSEVVRDSEGGGKDLVSQIVGSTPERKDLIFLGIDEASLSLSGLGEGEIAASETLPMLRGRFPWDRRVWAAAIDRLAEAGASLIVLDIFFTEPSDDAGADEALEAAIARHRDKIVLASRWGAMGQEKGTKGLEKTAGVTTLTEPLPDFIGPPEHETAIGFVNFWPDRDGMIRKSYFRISRSEVQMDLERHPEEPVFESLAGVVGRRMGVSSPDGPMRLRYVSHYFKERGRVVSKAYSPLSFYTIFLEQTWSANYGSGSFFKDKVVLIGPAAPQFQDMHATPVGVMSGPQLHLQALGCLLAGQFFREAPPHWHWAGLLGMAMLGGLLVSWIRNPLGVLFTAAVFLVVWFCGVVLIAQGTEVLSGGVAGALGLIAVVLPGESYEFLMERIQRQRLHGQLSRSVSRDVADAMVKSPDGYLDTAKGGRREIVVLFSDVRSFTARSEQQHPEELVEQLNEYLSRMVNVVFRNGGTLDKFIGDALMVTWGGLEDTPPETMARAALKASWEMREELQQLNAEWEDVGKEPFEAGIGIHLGDAVVGEIGSRQRSDFTAIGDAVNLASRIEGMTKMLRASVLVSGQVADLAADDSGLCSLGRFRVKGRQEPVSIYSAFVNPEEAFAEAMACLARGELADAERVLRMIPSDSDVSGAVDLYLKQLEACKSSSAETWDGVITLDSK